LIFSPCAQRYIFCVLKKKLRHYKHQAISYLSRSYFEDFKRSHFYHRVIAAITSHHDDDGHTSSPTSGTAAAGAAGGGRSNDATAEFGPHRPPSSKDGFDGIDHMTYLLYQC
jgi:hypothetical protein